MQALLSEQLGSLERRLVRKRHELQLVIADVEEQLLQQSPQSIRCAYTPAPLSVFATFSFQDRLVTPSLRAFFREYVKLYLRELLQVVTELMTGNYTIIRLPGGGSAFMDKYGGSTGDNLEDGHRLAMELFPDPLQYDPKFLQTTLVRRSSLALWAVLETNLRYQLRGNCLFFCETALSAPD